MGFLGRGERDQLSSSLQVTGGLAPGPQLAAPPSTRASSDAPEIPKGGQNKQDFLERLVLGVIRSVYRGRGDWEGLGKGLGP